MSILKDCIQKIYSISKVYNLEINNYQIINNEVIFSINNFNLYTDFCSYCYIDNEELDFNYNILLKIKSPKNIISELLNIKIEKIHNDINEDPFNILNNNIKLFTKNEINYSKLSLVPKSLILSSYQICNMIINELKKVNYNKSYKHYININYEEPFILIIKLFIKSHIIEFKLILDTFPYLPPQIEYISPSIKDELYFALLNLNILQLKNWSSNITIEYIIVKIAEILEPIFENYITDIDNINNILYKNIINIAYLTKDENIDILKLDIDIPKNNIESENKYWKSGTGYSSNNSIIKWDFNKYISEQEILNNKIINNFKNINNIFIENINIIYRETDIINKYLINYINKKINEINILELDNNLKLYNEIFTSLEYIYQNKYIFEKIKITNNFIQLNEELDINNLLDDIKYKIKLIIQNILSKVDIKVNEKIYNNNYCDIMKKLQFTNKYNIPSYHNFYNINYFL